MNVKRTGCLAVKPHAGKIGVAGLRRCTLGANVGSKTGEERNQRTDGTGDRRHHTDYAQTLVSPLASNRRKQIAAADIGLIEKSNEIGDSSDILLTVLVASLREVFDDVGEYVEVAEMLRSVAQTSSAMSQF